MQLFQSDMYVPAKLDDTSLPTPLGDLSRTYVAVASSCSLKLAQQSWRHSARNSVVYRWVSSDCILEELITDFVPPRLESPVDCSFRCVVARLRTSARIQEFDASLLWQTGYSWTEGEPESGGGLEARSWNDGSWKVSIGTEDFEFLAARSRRSDWMPRRLASYIENNPDDVVRVRHDSVSIHFPLLNSDECLQFQFVIASGPMPDRDSVLWLSVDQNPDVLLDAGSCK